MVKHTQVRHAPKVDSKVDKFSTRTINKGVLNQNYLLCFPLMDRGSEIDNNKTKQTT